MVTGTVLDVLEYNTKAGDTFDTIALELYNEERMASVLMQYNRDEIGTLVFGAGVKLRLPVFDRAADVDTAPPWRS
jgi:hypothetical protein